MQVPQARSTYDRIVQLIPATGHGKHNQQHRGQVYRGNIELKHNFVNKKNAQDETETSCNTVYS
jgi:hypothetical protein